MHITNPLYLYPLNCILCVFRRFVFASHPLHRLGHSAKVPQLPWSRYTSATRPHWEKKSPISSSLSLSLMPRGDHCSLILEAVCPKTRKKQGYMSRKYPATSLSHTMYSSILVSVRGHTSLGSTECGRDKLSSMTVATLPRKTHQRVRAWQQLGNRESIISLQSHQFSTIVTGGYPGIPKVVN